MKFEFGPDQSWESLDDWRRPLATGDAFLIDPATGETLNPKMPYEWLRDDDRLSQGYQYLARRGNGVDLTIFYNPHVAADDLGDPSKRWFENQLTQSDAFAFEGAGWSRPHYRVVLGRSMLNGAMPRGFPNDGFHKRLFRAVAETGVYSFGHDIEDTPIALDNMLLRLVGRWVASNAPMPPIVKFDWAVVTTSFREWYMVGKVGYELAQSRFADKDPLKIFMTVGSEHKDLTRKFRDLGVLVHPKAATGPRAELGKDIIYRMCASSLLPAHIRYNARFDSTL